MEDTILLLSFWAQRKNKEIVKVKLSPNDLAEYNKAVFSSGRIVMGPTGSFSLPRRTFELKSDRFIPRKIVQIFYDDEE